MRRARLADCILAGAAALIALSAVRGLALWRALRAHGASDPRLTAALAVAVLLAAALLAALALPRPRRVNLALALVSGVFALYVGELGLAAQALTPRRLREKLALLERYAAAGRPASPGVEPVRFMWIRPADDPQWLEIGGRPTLPLGGIARRLTVDCKEGGDWMVFETDEHGFNNPPGLWAEPPLDLAFLGDSFVHGSCVRAEETLVARVRARHPATLGLAMPGSGPLTMLATLREYLPALRPRTVLWCYYPGNDLLDLRRERGHPLLPAYLEAGHAQGLAAEQPALDRALQDFVDARLLPHVRHMASLRPDLVGALALREVRARAGLALAEPYALAPTEDELALFARVLREARATVSGWGGRLVFVYLPAWPEPARQLGEKEYARGKEETARRVRALVAEMGLPLVDVEAAFRRDPQAEGLYACPGCHYSPAGYALAARAVLATLDGAAP